MLGTTDDPKLMTLISDLNTALAARDTDRILSLFQEDCHWRDLLTFTWNFKTLSGKRAIGKMLKAQLAVIAPSNVKLDPTRPSSTEADVHTFWITFETGSAQGEGLLRIRDGKIWTMFTAMASLTGYEEPGGTSRPFGARHGSAHNALTWLEEREKEEAELGYETQPYVLVVGGGQGGIALGARLRQHGVPTLIVDRNNRPGDSWRNRYKSLCLHDPVWYDHLPYLPFPSNWPVFSPKDKIGDWLEMYTKVMELNYWTGSAVTRAKFDVEAQEWVVQVDRDGTPVTLRPKQLVFATGMSGKAVIPNFPGKESFTGDQQHSSTHPGPEAYEGKKAVVIGSNNSAHDICAALWEEGADVTMVQRSSTHIVQSDLLMRHGLSPLYSEEAVAQGMTTELADLTFASIPYTVLHDFQKPVYDAIREEDAEFYSDLEKAGFELDYGADDTGLFMKYLRRGSGYYIDIGASQMVIDGKIKLARGQVAEIIKDGVLLEGGTKLDADLIVYATGYGSMNGWVADIVDQETADKVGKVWGLGSNTPKDPGPWEGELRNMWKPTQQEAMWFHGGNLHQSRHFSHYLALQLKARLEGIETPVFGLQDVHHKG
ncbi:MAG: NAD(P)/FAD-dependent oxidoreductase [Marinovum sp.]|nr:NAD(P)/FAD-dependent oxidoreductase [Marinovum sp.]MBT6526792.1 NAD(P)/FAD-dependent oxidoreductase [Marinovum sp.]